MDNQRKASSTAAGGERGVPAAAALAHAFLSGILLLGLDLEENHRLCHRTEYIDGLRIVRAEQRSDTIPSWAGVVNSAEDAKREDIHVNHLLRSKERPKYEGKLRVLPVNSSMA
ncbi:hypothetical protein N7532_007058 [Penicillium argentinense]|uniref:Uncharacterized protein n=1 Tax=Penicillium argentinense TaxID=1131581 RepID=A0A9W9FHH2_9EURO|nr:uncharacterized protein N7532_007058 [Penicillium argentinense]KAJ5100057.1 hypothetical protein N7532_007058 [Penicillium argentinense]